MKPPRKPKLKLKHERGMPETTPEVVEARAVAVTIDKTEQRRLDLDGGVGDDYTWQGEVEIQFNFTSDGQEFSAKETFNRGDVYPELGGWVRGVAVYNQWGSLKFRMTHMLERA